MTEPFPASPPSLPASPVTGRRLMLRVLQVRLRFFVAISLMALLAVGWPWLQNGWDNLVMIRFADSREPAISSATEFFCPMDAGVVSAWPSICPICNMDLITRKKGDAVLLPDGALARMQISPYRIQMAGIRTVDVEPGPALKSDDDQPPESSTVRIPVSAIVERGAERLVYVQTMPGMFDALPVTIEHRDGDHCRVSGKILPGQQIVAQGAFLIDAESRLNPSLSTQFFGAHQLANSNGAAPSIMRPLQTAKSTEAASLTASERQLVDNQKTCPVTQAPLGSMGKPIFVTVNERQIALCCSACRDKFLRNSDMYLEWLDQQASTVPRP